MPRRRRASGVRKSFGESITWPEIVTPRPEDDPARFRDRNGGVSRPETSASEGVSVYGHLGYKGFSLKGSYQYFDNHIPFAPDHFNWTVYCNNCNADSSTVDGLINAGGQSTVVTLNDHISPLNAGSHTTLYSDLSNWIGGVWR